MKFIKIMLQNVRRSPYQALAAILIITQTFFVISVFTFVIVASSKVISYFESVPKVTAFFNDDAKQSDIDSLESRLKSTGTISQMHFVSKQEALDRYKQYNKNDPLLLDLVSADILPSSLEVSTTKIDDLSMVSDMMKSSSAV